MVLWAEWRISMETKVFDKVTFEVGDEVIRKFKEDGATKEIVSKSIMVENLDGFSYSVLFFESNPNSFHVGYEYEPFTRKDKAEYYNAWSDAAEVKTKPKSKGKVKVKSKVIKLKLDKDEKP